ncbi:protein CASC3-like isoform X3 [Prorops nasuta]|uniref:protein CASC3-like isoform X3 n=1 Tax=Prorops nasuta TaxID=863751 RepID=UPI0034CEE63F
MEQTKNNSLKMNINDGPNISNISLTNHIQARNARLINQNESINFIYGDNSTESMLIKQENKEHLSTNQSEDVNNFACIVLESIKSSLYSKSNQNSISNHEMYKNMQTRKLGSFYNKSLDTDNKKASWYYHRTGDKPSKRSKVKMSNRNFYMEVKEDKWCHDKYNDTVQAPKSREEIIETYGYDIRSCENPPNNIKMRYKQLPDKSI